MITITLVDNGTKRYAMVTTGTILGRMYDNNAETITVVKPASEAERTCTMIVTAASSGCFAAKTIDEIEVGNEPVNISNALSQYNEVKIGFSFSDDTGYVKNSEVQTFKFLEAQKPDSWQPDDSEMEYKVENLLQKGFVDVSWSATSQNTLVFKNLNGDIVDEIELTSFEKEQSDLAETNTSSATYVRNKSTKYLENEGSDGSSPYATQQYVQENGGKIDSISVNNIAQTIDENKNVNITVPTNTSDLNNNSGFITNTVNNLTNYYLKSQTYTQAEVNSLIEGIKNVEFQIVAELPTASATTYFNVSKTIYMVPNSSTGGTNYYDEYITIRSGTEGSYTYSWENIGSTQVDLTNYVQKTTTIAGVDLQDNITASELRTGLNVADGANVTSISGSGAPTTSTAAAFVGQLYLDTTNNNTYQCTDITEDTSTTPSTFSYTWVKLIRENNIANYDDMGVIKVSEQYGTFYASGFNGILTAANRTYSQYQSEATGRMLIGKGTLENVIDGKGIVECVQGSVTPTSSTVCSRVGCLYLDTTNNKTYQCTAITEDTSTTPSIFTYTWNSIGGGIARL